MDHRNITLTLWNAMGSTPRGRAAPAGVSGWSGVSGAATSTKCPIDQPINTLSGRFRCVRELRDLTTRANVNQKPHVSSFATRGGTLHYCSQISRVVTNNITGNQAFSLSLLTLPRMDVWWRPPCHHLNTLRWIPRNHDRLALAHPPSRLRYCIRYRDGLRDKRGLAVRPCN
jgi:hypothetical protein